MKTLPAPPPVRPRVLSPITGDSIPVDEEIRTLISQEEFGHARLVGRTGAGKTTALHFLAGSLRDVFSVVLCGDESLEVRSPRGALLLVSTANGHSAPRSFEVPPIGDRRVDLTLAPWSLDECCEYLWAIHRSRCGSVMQRLAMTDDHRLAEQCPVLWRLVLDEMAGDETLLTVRSALRRALVGRLLDDDLWSIAVDYCLARLTGNLAVLTTARKELDGADEDGSLRGLLARRSVQILLAADRIIDELVGERECSAMDQHLPHALLAELGSLASKDRGAVDRLEEMLQASQRKCPATPAGILHAAGVGWRPKTHPINLERAILKGAKWQGVCLKQANLKNVDLQGADLTQAVLDKADGSGGRFCGALLKRASLDAFRGEKADFTGANLQGVSAEKAWLTGAAFRRANLQGANLQQAKLKGVDLRGADLQGAALSWVDLSLSRLDEADLSCARLYKAKMNELVLHQVNLDGARLESASMRRCDLEYMRIAAPSFHGAVLEGSLFTGSWMTNADFVGANLCNTGLADIQWEHANLRDADLRGSSFHLGSSRCGLVGSPIPCEGSRTGFYTDEYGEQYFKAPEEIRKANLCGADLRGARIGGVDFYLVDLRGAIYDEFQRKQFRQCGAILGEE